MEWLDLEADEIVRRGVAGNPIDCGVTIQNDLFTHCLGLAYRPLGRLVIRGGYSRNRQKNNVHSPSFYLPRADQRHQDWFECLQPSGTVEGGFSVPSFPDLSVGK